MGSLLVHVGSYLGDSATLSSKWIAVILHVYD